MRYLIAILVVLALASPIFAETWKNAPLVDTMCASKVKDNPDKHTVACTKMCAKDGGVGILTADGAFLKFDESGNKQAMALVDKTKKKDHLRATVTGERSGDTIKVQTISLD